MQSILTPEFQEKWVCMKNQEHYQRVKLSGQSKRKPLFNRKNWWLAPVIFLSVLFVGPLMAAAKRHSFIIINYMDVVQKNLLFVVIVVFILMWFVQIEPALISRRGYLLRGRFKVVKKDSWLGVCFVHLSPGDANKVMVDSKFFHDVNVGDEIIIERNALGRLEKLTKVSSLKMRIRNLMSSTQFTSR